MFRDIEQFENTRLAITVAFTRQIHESPLTDKAALFFGKMLSKFP